MKKLLLSITLFGSLIGNAQILTQDFQGEVWPPAGWTTETNVPSRPWDFTTTIFNATGQATFNITGGKSAAIAWIAQDQDAHLTSPSFSLVGYSDASFEFKVKVGWSYMINQAAGDLFALISTDGGATWNQLWVEEDQGFGDDGDGDPDTDLYDTQTAVLDITSYVGNSDVKIRFQYIGNDADSVSIDDVIVNGTLGINEVLSSSFATFPNPADNVITLTNSNNSSVESISISDINGRTIKSIEVDNVSEVQINVSDLNSGVYFMSINTAEGKAVKKFIKN